MFVSHNLRNILTAGLLPEIIHQIKMGLARKENIKYIALKRGSIIKRKDCNIPGSLDLINDRIILGYIKNIPVYYYYGVGILKNISGKPAHVVMVIDKNVEELIQIR